MPFIGQEELFKEFKLDEPWDSPHNKKLIAKMPPIFAPAAADKIDAGLTFFQVFTGPEMLFEGTKMTRLAAIRHGPDRTILVVEANEPVFWTKPADLHFALTAVDRPSPEFAEALKNFSARLSLPAPTCATGKTEQPGQPACSPKVY